uniref:Uncharacterized protein n=2 Tax=Bursaphelenchus xylophilus TaxID=6326 RepID=A0A1I7S8W4_BURXY
MKPIVELKLAPLPFEYNDGPDEQCEEELKHITDKMVCNESVDTSKSSVVLSPDGTVEEFHAPRLLASLK